MSRMKITLSGTCAALLLTAGLVTAQGQTLADRSTIVTFSGAVSIPGVAVLPAGSYLFRLADSLANRNIVQIFDKDRTHLFATLLAIPAERSEVKGDAVVTFKETRADTPPAVHFWYYAGEKNGQEFAYPREQAMQIANASGESVLAGNFGKDIEGMKDTEVSRVQPNANAEPAQSPVTPEPTAAPPAKSAEARPPTEPQPMTPPSPATEPRPMAAPTPAPAVTPTPTPEPVGTAGRTTSTTELPKTASQLPLVGLVGLLALGGAIAVRTLRRRVA